MPLAPGTRLGPFEILTPIGAGGMGEVYRARDTRLNREVAIKVSGDRFSDRFEREAHSIAALNHPNICTLHDVGPNYLVMELLEGPTLADRIQEGAVFLDEALTIARQIAEALGAAHEKGIVHRDLKPGNIKIKQDGTVKVLDFGLAKVIEPNLGEGRPEESPTLTFHQATRTGVILGTAAYMAPEQARGKPVDKRADIWAFGVVLYEMLTGRQAFRGETITDLLAAVVKEEPDLTRVPAKVRRLLQSCLQKDPKQRLQAIGDWSLLLDDAPLVRDPAIRAPWRWFAAVAIVAVVAALAGAWLERTFFGYTAPPAFTRLTFENGYVFRARFASDGRTIVYNAAWNGGAFNVFSVRTGEQGSAVHSLPNSLLFSLSSSDEMAVLEDVNAIISFNQVGRLARVPLSGGAPRVIVDDVADADWEPNGERQAVVHWVNGVNRLEYPIGHVLYEGGGYIDSPRIAPHGDRIAFADHPVVGDDRGSVAVVDLTGKKTTLSSGWSSVAGVVWAPGGNEVWFAAATKGWADTLWAVTLTGKQRELFRSPTHIALFDAGRDGRVLLDSRSVREEMIGFRDGETKERNLSWLDGSVPCDLSSDGATLLFKEVAGALNYYVCIRKTDGSPVIRLGDGAPHSLSADGRWVLAEILTTPPQFELIPTGAGEIQRLPQIGLNYQEGAQWFPDTRRIMFAASELGHGTRLWVQDVFPPGKPRPFTAEGMSLHGNSISPDGKMVVASGQDRGLSLYPIDGERPRPLRGIEANDRFVRWSGDGNHIFVLAAGRPQASIYKIDIETGRRENMRELTPSDPSGLRSGTYRVVMTPDGKSGVYNFIRILSKLQLLEGLR